MRRYLPNSALYYLTVAGLLVVFQQVWRLILLVRSTDLAAGVPLSTVAKSFLVGLQFDLAVTGYTVLPLVILGMLPGWDISRRIWIRRLNFALLVLMAAAVFFVHLADIEFFRFFNVRLNGTAHLWAAHPNVMFPMLWETYPVIRYLILYGVVLGLFIVMARRLRAIFVDRHLPSPVGTQTVSALLLIIVFGLAARGRLEEKSPLRWGMAYFSDHAYANQLALNPAFTYFQDLIYDAGSLQQVEELMARIADPGAEAIARGLLGSPGESGQRIHRHVTFDPPNAGFPNVIVIIMESFGSTAIRVLDTRWPYDLSPCFDSLSKEGILFTNIYSAGEHTYTGLFGTLYGYPPGFGNAVMKRALGRDHHWGLPQILKQRGYRTYFFATSDPHFDNMQGFLMANGIETVSALFDYTPEEKISSMGVPDHVMFDHAADMLRSQPGGPFFAALLTGSNHGPWIIPDVPLEKLPESEKYFRERMALKYSDWSLGRFVRMLDSDSAFDNTLVVVTSDNGLPNRPVTDLDLTQYKIPLLLYWIGPDRPAAIRSDRLGSQMDIVATVMAQLRLDYDDHTFGKNLLDTTKNVSPFALFSEWYKIGYIEDGFYSIIRLDGPQSLYRLADPARDVADSLAPIREDHRRKALALYQTAYYNAQRPIDTASASRAMIR